MSSYTILITKRFEKDLEICKKRGLKLSLLYTVIEQLKLNGTLPKQYRAHKLSGNYANYWECHIKGDWLLRIMYWTLFLTFVKIGTFTIGGGYAMLPLIQREVVDKGWLSKEDFIDLFSVAQSLPGIFAVNISIFVGYKLKRVPGGIVCALGSILPSFFIILAIALFFTHVQDNIWVEKAFKGLRPAVVALIAVPCLTTARSIKMSYKELIIPIAAALLIWQGGLSPVWIILAAIIGGLVYGLKIKKD